VISYFSFNNSKPAMICRSTGRLIESVQWFKEEVLIASNNSDYMQDQKIISFSTS